MRAPFNGGTRVTVAVLITAVKQHGTGVRFCLLVLGEQRGDGAAGAPPRLFHQQLRPVFKAVEAGKTEGRLGERNLRFEPVAAFEGEQSVAVRYLVMVVVVSGGGGGGCDGGEWL